MKAKKIRDDRVYRDPDEDRVPRTGNDVDRAPAEFVLESGRDRKRMFRDEFSFEALPKPPNVPGWHFVWITTTNKSDPPHRRIRMGYQPVKAEEFPEFSHLRSKAGEWEGCISINEMLLFKIPEDIYQAIMKEFHHYAPAEEEERLKNYANQKHTNSDGKVTAEVIDLNEQGPTTMSIPVQKINQTFE